MKKIEFLKRANIIDCNAMLDYILFECFNLNSAPNSKTNSLILKVTDLCDNAVDIDQLIAHTEGKKQIIDLLLKKENSEKNFNRELIKYSIDYIKLMIEANKSSSEKVEYFDNKEIGIFKLYTKQKFEEYMIFKTNNLIKDKKLGELEKNKLFGNSENSELGILPEMLSGFDIYRKLADERLMHNIKENIEKCRNISKQH